VLHTAVHRSAADPDHLLSVHTVADPRPGRVVVEVVGEVDVRTAPALDIYLQSKAGRPGVRELVVYLGQVRFLGVAGIRVLARADRRCRMRGVRLVIRTGGRRAVLRALQLAGLDQIVAVDPADGDLAHPRVGRRGAGWHCRSSAMTRRRGRDPQPGPRRPA
jgi:anti-anti-sigma factor